MCNQLFREQDIDVGRQNKPANGPAYADILGDHLEQGQMVGMAQSGVDRWRHTDDPRAPIGGFLGPAEDLGQGGPVGGWIPFDEHQFGREFVAAALVGDLLMTSVIETMV